MANININLSNYKGKKEIIWKISDNSGNEICSYKHDLSSNLFSIEIPTTYAIKLQNAEYILKYEIC